MTEMLAPSLVAAPIEVLENDAAESYSFIR